MGWLVRLYADWIKEVSKWQKKMDNFLCPVRGAARKATQQMPNWESACAFVVFGFKAILMQFRVGQRVRMLHESGEGVITQLVDQHHVEVDMGDDFPLEVHIKEIIPIHPEEAKYLGGTTSETPPPVSPQAQVMGIQLLELSLVISQTSQEPVAYEAWLINPEPVTVLFTCYLKAQHKFSGTASGQLLSGSKASLGKFSQEQLQQVKLFYFQLLRFSPGRGHPHAAEVNELKWTRNALFRPSRHLPYLGQDAWVFPLRMDPQAENFASIPTEKLEQVRQEDEPVARPELEVDLHIEELVPNPHQLAPSEMLQVQLRKLETILSDALVKHYARVVIIHGVGEGTLRKAVRERLKLAPHVKSFASADPVRYGNGATEIFFH